MSSSNRSSRRSIRATPSEIDASLHIDRKTIARLHDRAYFAQQSVLVNEDLKTVACISSPERRTLINGVVDIRRSL